jgi:hypothetical protein
MAVLSALTTRGRFETYLMRMTRPAKGCRTTLGVSGGYGPSARRWQSSTRRREGWFIASTRVTSTSCSDPKLTVLPCGSSSPLMGASPGDNHGTDVSPDGLGVVRDQRLYQLVRQSGAIADHTFEIEFLDPGVHAYSFTFG